VRSLLAPGVLLLPADVVAWVAPLAAVTRTRPVGRPTWRPKGRQEQSNGRSAVVRAATTCMGPALDTAGGREVAAVVVGTAAATCGAGRWC